MSNFKKGGNGNIIFSHRHTLLLEQFERYGSNWFDDLPDACEMAITSIKDNKRKIIDKPSWL